MRILFMGTPDFAVESLSRLVEEGFNVCAVFTQPDKPFGRKKVLTPPPIKVRANELGIEVYQPEKLKDAAAQDLLNNINPDIIIVVAYGKILPKYILDYPKYGCINVHGSLLPRHRGAAPIQWSIMSGDMMAGVTTMNMAEELDAGDILLMESVPILENETGGELYDRLKVLGADLLINTIRNIGSINPVKQDDSMATYAPMLNKNMSYIDFNKKSSEILRFILGLNPWPVASTYINHKFTKVYFAQSTELKSTLGAGSLYEGPDRTGIYVVVFGGEVIKLLDIQMEGSKRMSAETFLRGNKIENIGH